jgi:hypothetical protein
MLRLLELALFLSPFVAFALWRLLAPARPPSARAVALAAGVLAVLAGALFWYSREDVLPPGTEYAPAQLQDGRLVPGHAVPR